MFVGREKEIKLIKEFSKIKGKALIIYGKKKVGETTLLKEALKNEKYVYFECIKSTLIDNVNAFVNTLIENNIIDFDYGFNNMISVFKYLNSLNIKLNIIIDEYPYLKLFEKGETIDSIFQNIIDNYLSNISLFISGSHIGMMKNMLEENMHYLLDSLH